MKNAKMIFTVIALAFVVSAAAGSHARATMMGPGQGMMGGPMMTNGGTFGMMNGMAGSPVIGDDGTAYLVSYVPAANPGPVPSSASFQSRIIAVTPAGAVSSLTLSGIVSRPVVAGSVLVASASLPDFTNYMMYKTLGTNSPADQSSLYIVTLPLSGTTKPTAVSLDGEFASMPVVDAGHNRIYVTTTDFGNGMMTGSNGYTMMYGTYTVDASTAKSYLYLINFDGTYTKVPLQ